MIRCACCNQLFDSEESWMRHSQLISKLDEVFEHAITKALHAIAREDRDKLAAATLACPKKIQ